MELPMYQSLMLRHLLVPPHFNRSSDLRFRLVALLVTAATTRQAERFRCPSIVIRTLGPPSAHLQGEHTSKGDAANEVTRCESESRGAQVGREFGTRKVGREHDIVGEYACNR
jgi:hypothetical protein